jgi:hypothetical protein
MNLPETVAADRSMRRTRRSPDGGRRRECKSPPRRRLQPSCGAAILPVLHPRCKVPGRDRSATCPSDWVLVQSIASDLDLSLEKAFIPERKLAYILRAASKRIVGCDPIFSV